MFEQVRADNSVDACIAEWERAGVGLKQARLGHERMRFAQAGRDEIDSDERRVGASSPEIREEVSGRAAKVDDRCVRLELTECGDDCTARPHVDEVGPALICVQLLELFGPVDGRVVGVHEKRLPPSVLREPALVERRNRIHTGRRRQGGYFAFPRGRLHRYPQVRPRSAGTIRRSV